MAQQFPLPFPYQTAIKSFETFLPTAQQSTLLKMLKGNTQWIGPWAALIGPAGTGKSHMLNAWSIEQDAKILSIEDLKTYGKKGLDSRDAAFFALDMEEHKSLDDAQSEGLFHLLNHIRFYNGRFLMVSRSPLGKINTPLKDLRSRFAAFIALKLDPYEDAQLAALLGKFASDQQLELKPQFSNYILSRSPRDAKTLHCVISTLAHISIINKKAVSFPLIKEALAKVASQKESH